MVSIGKFRLVYVLRGNPHIKWMRTRRKPLWIGNIQLLSMAMQQEPEIDWRYLPYIFGLLFRPIFREYPQKMWSYMVQYLHFRILNLPCSYWGTKCLDT